MLVSSLLTHWFLRQMSTNHSTVAIALVTHAPLGQALQLCAQHVLNTSPDLVVADILPTDLPEPWINQLVHQLRQTAKPYVLLLCDLYGSTPYHIATGVQRQLTIKGQQVHLLSGVNVCMLVKALSDTSASIDEVIKNTLYATQRGVVHQAPTSP